ncbi:hypothetical protein GYMLUDRAFT_160896, partial [Collybiopsis luxurians FD-317 M1]
ACQLSFLLLYVNGAGLKDGETNEQYFSKSNALASATRHTSQFHCCQMISEYAYHNDNFETYPNLSRFLYSHYKNCLRILSASSSLEKQLKAAGINNANVIFQWLEEEAQYLQACSREPPEETLQMEYFSKLKAYYQSCDNVKELRKVWSSYKPGEVDYTACIE